VHTISAFVPYHTFPSVQLLIESCSIADQEANNKEHTKRQFNIILEILLTFSVSHVNVTSVLSDLQSAFKQNIYEIEENINKISRLKNIHFYIHLYKICIRHSGNQKALRLHLREKQRK